MNPSNRTLVVLAALGVIAAGWLVWAVGHTASPPWPIMIADLIAVAGLVVLPWLLLAGRGLLRSVDRSATETRLFSRVLVAAALIAGIGSVAALAVGLSAREQPEIAGGIALAGLGGATLVALLGGVLFPWTLLVARTLTRERAARARAEERAALAAHLHDSVLQALTVIHKQADDPRSVRRLARTTERELRAWLYPAEPAYAEGGADPPAMLAGQIQAIAADVEDLFDITVELVSVGDSVLDPPASAISGAVREALTNAAKHSGVRHVALLVEVDDDEIIAVIRDRGCGFDPAGLTGTDRRGIAHSIVARVRAQGGTADIRSAPGGGTEVSLSVPRASWHD